MAVPTDTGAEAEASGASLKGDGGSGHSEMVGLEGPSAESTLQPQPALTCQMHIKSEATPISAREDLGWGTTRRGLQWLSGAGIS